MKKIFLTFLIFLSLSYAKDLDILSIASNGSLSDKTSHKLNDDELKQVVGGFYILNTNKPYFTDSVINNYGQKFGFTAYYELGYSDNFEKSLIDNANFRFNDKVVIKAHYNFKTGKSDIQLVGFNKYTKQIRIRSKISCVLLYSAYFCGDSKRLAINCRDEKDIVIVEHCDLRVWMDERGGEIPFGRGYRGESFLSGMVGDVP